MANASSLDGDLSDLFATFYERHSTEEKLASSCAQLSDRRRAALANLYTKLKSSSTDSLVHIWYIESEVTGEQRVSCFASGAASSTLASRLEPLLLRLVKNGSVEERARQSLECELGHVASWESDCRYAFPYEPLTRLMGNATVGIVLDCPHSYQ